MNTFYLLLGKRILFNSSTKKTEASFTLTLGTVEQKKKHATQKVAMLF